MEQLDPLRVVGQRLRFLRESRNLTQQQLAEQVGMHYTTVGEHERGDRAEGMSISAVLAYADALECSLDELFGRAAPTPIGELRTEPIYFIDEGTLRKVLAATSREELAKLHVNRIPWAVVVSPGDRLVEKDVWEREGDKVAAIRRRFGRRK